MSKIADAIITFWEAYNAAEKTYDYHEGLVLKNDVEDPRGHHIVQASLACAKMYGISAMSNVLFGDELLQERFAKKDFYLLVPGDFKDIKSS